MALGGVAVSYERGTPVPPKALRGGISKSILQRPCQFLAINAHEMAPRTRRWLQERGRDAPTYGPLWLPYTFDVSVSGRGCRRALKTP